MKVEFGAYCFTVGCKYYVKAHGLLKLTKIVVYEDKKEFHFGDVCVGMLDVYTSFEEYKKMA